jgi:glycerophosphoryl diester phosphodiesterase
MSNRFRLSLVLGVALGLASCATTSTSGDAAFDLQGHRGARGLLPENTLPAFAKALSLGVTTLEMDAAITKDDVVVVSHDPALNPNITRGPDGKFLEGRGPLIRDLTHAELMRYDVGRLKPDTSYARAYPDQVPLDGTRIPKLSEVFALVKRSGNERVQFDIETKVFPLAPQDTLPPDVFARRLVAEIRAAGMASRTMIQSFDWRTLQVVKREAPEIRTVYLSARRSFLDNICTGAGAGKPEASAAECGDSAWTAGFQLKRHGSLPKMVKAAGGDIWSPYHGDLDATQRAEAKALGLKVVPWTVNDPAQIAKVLDLAPDGIISDRPDRVREEMRRRGMPLPPATPVEAR